MNCMRLSGSYDDRTISADTRVLNRPPLGSHNFVNNLVISCGDKMAASAKLIQAFLYVFHLWVSGVAIEI